MSLETRVFVYALWAAGGLRGDVFRFGVCVMQNSR